MTGVYQIECLKNKKKYIGVSKDIKKRWTQHRSSLHKGFHHSNDMQKDYNLYGENYFEFKIIKECSYTEAKALEEQLIQTNQPEYNAYTNGKGLMYHTVGKAVEIETKLIQTVMPFFTTKLKEGKCFMMTDLFYLSDKSGISPTQILRYAEIDQCKKFNFVHCLTEPFVIGLLPTNEGLNVTFCREDCECNDYYILN